jgi:type IV pilus assembly protein PilB
MGIEPFLITSSLIGVIGQRLLRTICPYCNELRPTDELQVAQILGISEDRIPEVLPVGRGCDKCGGRGIKGRTAVYELLSMTDTIRDMITHSAPVDAIQESAVSDGMMTMRGAGVEKVLKGIVTPDELVRVLFSEDL